MYILSQYRSQSSFYQGRSDSGPGEKKVYLLWIISELCRCTEHSTFSFINIHFLISHQSASLDLSVTCTAASLINGHWLKIRSHVTIVLIKIRPSPWTRYHAKSMPNPKPVDLSRLVNQNQQVPKKGALYR